MREDSAVEIAEKVVVNGSKYCTGNMLAVDHDGQFIRFGKIKAIIVGPDGEAVFLLTLFHTVDFDYHVNSYVVQETHPSTFHTTNVDSLLDFHPLDCVDINGNWYIRLKYSVIPKVY